MDFLELKHVSKSYMQGETKICVLVDLNFKFDFNKSYAITGASGAGKSTLINLFSATDLPDYGLVSWSDKFVVNHLSQVQKSQFWNKKLGLIFQQANLISELTVWQNVALKGLIAGMSNAYTQAQELLSFLGLAHRLDFFPDLLSRGEQQRVAIARAMMGRPSLILADEPTASLDRKNGELVIDLLINLAQKYHMGLIISTHDDYVANKLEHVVTILDCKLNLSR